MMNQVVNLLKIGLDGAMKRQKTITNNIANVDTPNYKRKNVNFKETLQKKVDEYNNDSHNLSLAETDSKHIKNNNQNANSQQNLKVSTDDTGNYRNDKNNVDIDVEMAAMAKNQIYYSTLSQQINNKFQVLNKVIDRGGS
jgi:flagellar basal-body rod protein FlgB